MKKILRMLGLACGMALFLALGITLPTNPSVSSATVGKDYLLYVNTGTVAVPVWTLVGGQRNATLNRSGDSIDISHKTSGGWKSSKVGLRGWSVDLSGLQLLNDDGVKALDYAFMNGLEVQIKFVYPDGTAQTGWGSLTDWSLDTPHDGEASLSGTIEGNGALTSRAPDIDPISATMSLAAAANKVFAITPTATTVSAVKDNGTALTVTEDYTYAAGTLTILDDYLSTIAIGVHAFEITTGGGETLTVYITITA
jgi:TP901-1 family phage major tail protein